MTRGHIRAAQRAARQAGEISFEWGVPCPNGHTGQRRTSDMACIQCLAGVQPYTVVEHVIHNPNDVAKVAALIAQLNAAHDERTRWIVYGWEIAESAKNAPPEPRQVLPHELRPK